MKQKPKKSSGKKEPRQVIPAGKKQETGITRFIKVSEDGEVKDARLNNLEEKEEAEKKPPADSEKS